MEISSFLEKFNEINFQYTQYYWYDFAIISTGILAILNLITVGLVLYTKIFEGSVAGNSIIIPLAWGISLLIFFLIIVPISFVLFLISCKFSSFLVTSGHMLVILKQITSFCYLLHTIYFLLLFLSIFIVGW